MQVVLGLDFQYESIAYKAGVEQSRASVSEALGFAKTFFNTGKVSKPLLEQRIIAAV